MLFALHSLYLALLLLYQFLYIHPDPTAELEAEETNSVAVHTSVGASTGSVVTLGGGEGEVEGGGEGEEGRGGRLQLPQEQESLSDSVRRLQLSVQEYCPEQLKFAEKVYITTYACTYSSSLGAIFHCCLK